MLTNEDDPNLKVRRGETDIVPMDHSRIATYHMCPARYNFQYVKRLPRVASEAGDLGTVAHDFLEIYATQGLAAARLFVSALLPLGKMAELEKIQEAIEKIDFKGKPYSAEARYHFYATLDGKVVQYEAKIDLLYLYPASNEAEVIDGKSGRDVSSDISDDPQGKFYGLACLRSDELSLFDIKNIIFTQAQFRAGKLVPTNFTRNQLEQFEKQLHAITLGIIRDTEFKPRPGNHCSFCPYIYHCPQGQKITPAIWPVGGKIVKLRVETDEEARELAEQVVYLEAAVKRLKATLYGKIVQTDRDIEIEGGRWTLDTITTRSLAGGVTGVINRYPQEAKTAKESHYTKLVFKRK